MKTVQTNRQARQITDGRAPPLPLEYEAAIKSLTACLTLDDAKYWSDKADALAAWAKIYRSDDAGRKAKQLKLYAYRRMGQLAQELRPRRMIGGRTPDGRRLGSTPGPMSLLKEQGLKSAHVNAARKLSRMPKEQFETLVNSPKPPAIMTVVATRRFGSDSWQSFYGLRWSGTPPRFLSYCRGNPARRLAEEMTYDEALKALSIAKELIAWLDEFELHLSRNVCSPSGPTCPAGSDGGATMTRL